jgi:hypothetical protein
MWDLKLSQHPICRIAGHVGRGDHDRQPQGQDADRRTFRSERRIHPSGSFAHESRERGRRKTMQEALDEMVRDYCAKRGVKLPSAGDKK